MVTLPLPGTGVGAKSIAPVNQLGVRTPAFISSRQPMNEIVRLNSMSGIYSATCLFHNRDLRHLLHQDDLRHYGSWIFDIHRILFFLNLSFGSSEESSPKSEPDWTSVGRIKDQRRQAEQSCASSLSPCSVRQAASALSVDNAARI